VKAATTPATCAGRNAAYCAAAACFPTNPWLTCACRASGEVCRAVAAFTFASTEGAALELCMEATISPPVAVGFCKADANAKGGWFLTTNACIWGHWRAAFEAIHDPSRPVPTTLTPEWAAAVTICRASGIGSAACCRAHVEAEQNAIDRCGPYNSLRFGRLPTDVPCSAGCSSIVAAFTPPPPFTGDFGLVADRITYGVGRCCS
jgi:hypothetical protein